MLRELLCLGTEVGLHHNRPLINAYLIGLGIEQHDLVEAHFLVAVQEIYDHAVLDLSVPRSGQYVEGVLDAGPSLDPGLLLHVISELAEGFDQVLPGLKFAMVAGPDRWDRP